MSKRDRERPHAARPTDGLLQGDEEEQEREAADHLRHHDGRRRHPDEKRAAAEGAKPRERSARKRAENGGGGCRTCGYAQGQPGGIQDLSIGKKHAVPLESGRVRGIPDRDQAAVVEGVHDHRQDGHVEKHEPEHERAAREGPPPPSSHASPSASSSLRSTRCSSTMGTTSSRRIRIATPLATGQSRLSKNSSDSMRPIMIWSVRPSSVGITYSPTAGMKTSSDPAAMPGSDCGSVTRRKAVSGRAPRSAAASSSAVSCFSRLA